MLCEEVTALLPGMVDGDLDVDPAAFQHVETCLRCQAELARYRKMLRGLQLLRTRYLEPAPGLVAATLAAIEVAGERHAVRSAITGRRIAYAGAIGGAAIAASATAAALIVHHARRRSLPVTS